MFNRLKKVLRETKATELPSTGSRGDADLSSPEACKNRGNEHLAKGETEAALRCYEEAVRLDPGYADAFNNLGFLLLRLNRPEDAERHLRQAISLNPKLANAHYNLGTLLREQGRAERALASFREALLLNPNLADAHYEVGNLCYAAEKDDQALSSLERAIELDPDHFMAHHSLALVLQRLGRLDEAVERCRHAVELSANFFLATYNLGMIHKQRGQTQDAIACLNRTIVASPSFVEAYYELGNLLREQGQADAAMLYYEKAIALKPDYPNAHNNLGLSFIKQGNLPEATRCFRDAIRLEADMVIAHQNLADVLHKQGRLDEALASAERAIALDPALHEPHLVKGLALKGQGRLDEAMESFRRALTINPDSEATRFVMATTFLTRGELTEGWKNFRHRFFPDSPTCKRDFPQPEWAGETLTGKTILIWGDQGLGDEILFASMFADIIASAGHCIIECVPKLVSLFARSFPDATVIPRTDPPHPATRTGIDFQIAAADAAGMLRPTLASFPRHEGFLLAAPERVAYWKDRLAALGTGLKIGICWRSSVVSSFRSLYYTSLDDWGPIFSVPGVHFISLQYDECAAELDAARARFGVALHAFDEIDHYNDLEEAAALMKALDLVITAPTSVSSLAAAQNVPTWEMSFGTTWTTVGTDHMPWFPSLRPYSRRWDHRWDEMIATIAERLKAKQLT